MTPVLDLNALAADLELTDLTASPPTARLEQSWERPQELEHALVAWSRESLIFPLKTLPGVSYDFYHDLVLRYRRPLHEVIRWRTTQGGWEGLRLIEVQRWVSRLASAWRRHGVEVGQRAALLLPPGQELLIGALTCLRVGVSAGFIPPGAPALVSRRLEELKADFVLTNTALAGSLPRGTPTRLLDERGAHDDPDAHASHSWRPDEVVLRCFSPLRPNSWTPAELTAAELLRALLREAALTFRLEPGDALAGPGIDPLQYQPVLMLSALAVGATWLELSLSDLEQEPGLLARQPLKALIVTPGLRDQMLQSGEQRIQTRLWLRDPAEALEWEPWRRFIERAGLSGTLCANLLYEAASGGALLAGCWRPGMITQLVVPAPGRRWMLRRLDGSGARALTEYGVFEPEGIEPRAHGQIVLARRGGEMFYATRITSASRGRPFPAELVRSELATLPEVHDSHCLVVYGGETAGIYHNVLLVFVAPPTADTSRGEGEGALAQRILAHLRARLGEVALPDHVEILPFIPRRSGDGLDERWVEGQYVSGAFERKRKEKVFARVSRLRQALQEPARRPGGAPWRSR